MSGEKDDFPDAPLFDCFFVQEYWDDYWLFLGENVPRGLPNKQFGEPTIKPSMISKSGRLKKGTGPDGRRVPHDDYDYKVESYFYKKIKIMTGGVRNTVIWDVVNFIDNALGDAARAGRYAKRRLAVAYYFLDSHREKINQDLLQQAVNFAMTKRNLPQPQ
jgi:hypothetical protein